MAQRSGELLESIVVQVRVEEVEGLQAGCEGVRGLHGVEKKCVFHIG